MKAIYYFLAVVIIAFKGFSADFAQQSIELKIDPPEKTSCIIAGGQWIEKYSEQNPDPFDPIWDSRYSSPPAPKPACFCPPVGKYFDQDFSVCDEKISDRANFKVAEDDNRSYLSDEVKDFASLVKSYESDVCNSNLEILRFKALKVMENAVEVWCGEPWKTLRNNRLLNSDEFNAEIREMWAVIIEAVESKNQKDENYATLLYLFGNYEAEKSHRHTLNIISMTLSRGLIPLPIFLSKSKDNVINPDNDNIEEFFRLSKLKEYAFIGVAPVMLWTSSLADLHKQKLHPFRFNLMSDFFTFLDRGVQHAFNLAENLKRMGLPAKGHSLFYFSEQKCRAIKDIIDKASEMTPKEHGKDETKKVIKTYDRLIHYFMYQDRFILGSRQEINFNEFVVELVQEKLNKSIPEIILGDPSEIAKTPRIPALCRQIFARKNLKWSDDKRYDFLRPFLSQSEELIFNLGKVYYNLLDKLAASCATIYKVDPHEVDTQTTDYDLVKESTKAFVATGFLPTYKEIFEQVKDLFHQFNEMLRELPQKNLIEPWLRETH